MRSSNAAGGSSCLSQAINPRFNLRLLAKQFFLRVVQRNASIGSHQERVAENHISRQRQVRVRMRDENHVLFDPAIDILKHVRILVGVESQVVPADACVLRSRVLSKTFTTKDVILNPRDISNVYAGLQEFFSGLLCLMKYGERSLLLRTRFSENERPADLSVISVHLRAQF